MVTIDILGDGAIVPGKVSLCIQCQKAHTTGTGIFQIRVQEIGSLTYTGCAYHQAVDIVGIHQCCGSSFSCAPQHDPLGQRLSVGSRLFSLLCFSAPLHRCKRHMAVALFDFSRCCPPGSTVLSVANSGVLDPIETVAFGGKGNQGKQTQYTTD